MIDHHTSPLASSLRKHCPDRVVGSCLLLAVAVALIWVPLAQGQERPARKGSAPPVPPASSIGSQKAGTTPGAKSDNPAEAELEPVVNLNAYYRFNIAFTSSDKAVPGKIRAYHVAFLERIVSSTGATKSPFEANEQVTHVVYSERPARVESILDDHVQAAVRAYESVRFTPEQASQSQLFKKLAIWYQPRSNDPPLVLSLVPERRLDRLEYVLASRQVFYPDLVSVLPNRNIRVGDTYAVPFAGVRALAAAPITTAALIGKLSSIKADPADKEQRFAIFDIKGPLTIAFGDGTQHKGMIHTEVRFQFKPEAPTNNAGAGLASTTHTVLRCPGAISSVRLAQETSGPGDPQGKSSRLIRRELTLGCRPADTSEELNLPSPPPEKKPENSYLAYTDPKGRFELLYPQEYIPGLVREASGGSSPGVALTRLSSSGPELISLKIKPWDELKVPETVFHRKEEAWKAEDINFIKGDQGFLPGEKWEKRRVYRYEASLPASSTSIAGGGASRGRQYFYGYVVLGENDDGRDGLLIEATTYRDALLALFRAEVEEVARSFRFRDGEFRTPEPKPPAR